MDWHTCNGCIKENQSNIEDKANVVAEEETPEATSGPKEAIHPPDEIKYAINFVSEIYATKFSRTIIMPSILQVKFMQQNSQEHLI